MTAKTFLSRLMFAALLALPGAALASNGWYLLMPPRSEYDENAQFLSGYKILDGEPLEKWFQKAAYDSAAECESAKLTFQAQTSSVFAKSSEDYQHAISKNDPFTLKLQRKITEGHNADDWTAIASRCIATDDPRLASRTQHSK